MKKKNDFNWFLAFRAVMIYYFFNDTNNRIAYQLFGEETVIGTILLFLVASSLSVLFFVLDEIYQDMKKRGIK